MQPDLPGALAAGSRVGPRCSTSAGARQPYRSFDRLGRVDPPESRTSQDDPLPEQKRRVAATVAIRTRLSL